MLELVRENMVFVAIVLGLLLYATICLLRFRYVSQKSLMAVVKRTNLRTLEKWCAARPNTIIVVPDGVDPLVWILEQNARTAAFLAALTECAKDYRDTVLLLLNLDITNPIDISKEGSRVIRYGDANLGRLLDMIAEKNGTSTSPT